MANNETQQCPNGHAANSNGNCFFPGCVYRNSERHKGPEDK